MNIHPEWYQALFPAFVLLVLAFFARWQQRSWLAPGAFWLLFWSFAVWLPLIFAPHYVVWPPAIWYIIGSAFCVYIGSQIGLTNIHAIMMCSVANRINSQGGMFFQDRARFFILLFTAFGMVGVFSLFHSTGYRINILFSPGDLANMAGQLSIARYHYGYRMPLISRIMMSFSFAGCWLGALFFVLRKKRAGLLYSFIAICPLLIITMALTTRMAVIMGGIFWVAGYITANVYKYKTKARLFGFRQIVLAGVAGFLLVFLVLMAQMLRVGKMSVDVFFHSYERASTIFFSHLAGFSLWLRSGVKPEFSFGAYTFAGIFDKLGLKIREQGLFTEGVETADQQITNIYTLLRCLAEDFSHIGLFLFLFILGVVSGRAYLRAVLGRRYGIGMLSLFYVFTMWSHVTSILNYNNIILGFLIIFFCLQRVFANVSDK